MKDGSGTLMATPMYVEINSGTKQIETPNIQQQHSYEMPRLGFGFRLSCLGTGDPG